MPGPQNAWRLKRMAIAAAVTAVLVSIGFLAGFFTAKHIGTEMMTACYRGSPAAAAAAQKGEGPTLQAVGLKRGMPVDGYDLREVAPPWSAEADRFREMQTTAKLFVYYEDTESITEELTRAFLSKIEEEFQLSRHGDNANMTEIVEAFQGVARDVLNFLRYHNSQAILPLLREFSTQGTITVTNVSPDLLNQEVQQLLNVTQLGRWYADAASFDHPSITTVPPNWSSPRAPTEQLLAGSSEAASSGRRRRRRLQAGSQHWRRQLQAVGGGIPVIPSDKAQQEALPPTVSPLMGLQDMLCWVKPFSPTGLQGMLIPPNRNYSAMAKKAAGTAHAITCPARPKPAIFRYNNIVFKRVKIPVVFHCQRFLDGNLVMPPLWKAEESAKNLIDVTNMMYNNTFIEFELLEVRYDVKKFPYLLLNSLKDWQDCTGNPSQEVAGFPCLQETARFPEVASLAKKYVINVFVGGSQTNVFCNRTEAESCTTLYAGYTGSIGPWYTRPSPTWSENKWDENWVTISWDMFSPTVRNGWRFWDGGAVTLAHEFGHYLGLMHTHEGSKPCEGDGLGKADSVPDTPVNLQTVQWAADNGLAVQLARWCSQFRTGKKPDPKDLLVFNSCKLDVYTIDNVFNLLSYLPDQCCMLLTPNQIARLQWSIAKFRPKMMAAHAA